MSTPASPVTGQNDQATVQDFASRVRTKFPGAYDDLDDVTLSQKVVAKHPQYSDMLPKSFGTAPVAPQPLVKKGALPRQGFKENFIQPAEDIALSGLGAAGMAAGGALAAAPSAALGPFAPAGVAAGAGLGSATGGSLERAIRRQGVAGHLPMPPVNAKRELIDTAKDFQSGAEGEMGAQAGAAVVGKAIPMAQRLLASPEKAGKLFERGVAPSGMAAEDQALMRENFQRASKYIAPETRGFPIEGGEGGAMRSATIAHRAADNLWQGTVEPVTQMFGDVQRPGDNVGRAIRSSFTDLDKTTKPAAVEAGNKLAEWFEGRAISVREMADVIRQLNNDRGVSRFYDMSPNEQVAAELADPSLRAKVETLKSLRTEMFDAIGDSGGAQLGKEFAEARKDWGALRSVEDQVRGARIPTPAPLITRLGGTVRGAISPHGTDFWMRPQETLLGVNNPNRLLTNSFNMLGRTDLDAPMMHVMPQVPRGLLPQNASRTIVTPPPTDSSEALATTEKGGPWAGIKNAPEAMTLHQNPSMRVTPGRYAASETLGGTEPETGPRMPAMDVQFGNRREVLPSSGKTIIPPRPGVEDVPGPRELGAGPEPQKQLPMPNVRRALPPINPRNASGAIEAGPSTEWGAPANERSRAIQEVENLQHLWSELPAPGRFVHNATEISQGYTQGKPDIVAFGIKSPKPAVEEQFPWLRDLPMMTLSRVKSALERGKGVDYDRVVKAATEYLRKQRGL